MAQDLILESRDMHMCDDKMQDSGIEPSTTGVEDTHCRMEMYCSCLSMKTTDAICKEEVVIRFCIQCVENMLHCITSNDCSNQTAHSHSQRFAQT